MVKTFKNYKKIFENPNELTKSLVGDNRIYVWDAVKNITFGYFNGKFKYMINQSKRLGNRYIFHDYTHEDLYNKYKELLTPEEQKNVLFGRTELAGRVFTIAKIISFWHYPKDKKELKKVCDDIKKETGLDIWKDDWKIEIYSSKTISSNINSDNKLLKDWSDEYKKEFDDLKIELIPIKQYKQSNEIPDNEKSKQHILSPMKKKKRIVPNGIGSKHKSSNVKSKFYLGKFRGENLIQNFKKFNKLN